MKLPSKSNKIFVIFLATQNGNMMAGNTNTFKAQLKKVEPKKIKPIQQNDQANNIIDFKSRLRKVPQNNGEGSSSCSEQDGENKKTDIKIEVTPQTTTNQQQQQTEKHQNDERKENNYNSNNISNGESDDGSGNKRRSTGSISSLKKLWETNECSTMPNDGPMQLSPKCNNNDEIEAHSNNTSSTSQLIKPKPMVPIKPVKLTIYATPQLQQQPPPPPLIETVTSREGILELVDSLESSLKTPVNTISNSQWLLLSDKLKKLQNSCVVYADNEKMPPHSKFQFRDILTRFEIQSNNLRSAAACKNLQDNEKVLQEVGHLLKQISNALYEKKRI